jgi:hypothetical protein
MYNDYGDITFYPGKIQSLAKIHKRYSNLDMKDIFITSSYNKDIYPLFDLDTKEKYLGFCEYTKNEYVAFQSSPEHYWVIIDKSFKSIKEFKKDSLFNDWSVFCDNNFMRATFNASNFLLRGTYDSFERQPIIIKKTKTLSENFTTFINKLEDYYSTDGLKFSSLKYKNADMLKQYNREEKLKRIINYDKI